MKTFEFKEVIEFLENNPHRVFNYGEPEITQECDSCLIASFFNSKGFENGVVSYEGDKLFPSWEARDKGEGCIAKINGGPDKIEEFHIYEDMGQRILNKIKADDRYKNI